MQELKVTGKGQLPSADRHYHIVYLNTEKGVGVMSVAKDGHTHAVIYDPPRPPRPPSPAVPPQIDPMTGMPMMVQDPNTGQMVPDQGKPEDPGDPGKEKGEWIVQPGGATPNDIHDHSLEEYEKEKPKEKESDKTILEECRKLSKEAMRLTSDSRKKGIESEGFYKGDKQWDPEVKRMLEGLDRAALTLNEVAPNIDTLIGYQMEQRTDIRCLPQEGGDQRVADMLNVAIKRILDNCYYQREETKVFKDICVPGMGAFNVYMDFNKSILGEIKVERFPWSEIAYGPHEKEDLSDCEFEYRSRMHSIAKLKQMYGEKADEIEKSYQSFKNRNKNNDPDPIDNGVNGTNTDYRMASPTGDFEYMADGENPSIDILKKEFRLCQITRKVYNEVTVVFNEEENFFFTAEGWRADDIKMASKLPGFLAISQMRPQMRCTRYCGDVVLSDENPADWPEAEFYTIPVYAYRQNNEFWGKVEAAKDPQRELNKRRSQIMDTMNRAGGSIFYTDPETFLNQSEEERFKRDRSKPGSIFKLNSVDRRPVLEQGAEIPVSLVNIMQMDQQNLQRLMNVVVQQEGANESGAMLLEKKKGRITGNQFLFDNLSFAKQSLGKRVIGLIQKYYPAERLERLLNSQYSKQPFKIGGEDFGEFSEQEIIEMLKATDLLEYDVIVAEAAFAPSTRLGIAKVLFELISQGASIPPALALEFVDMPSDVRARANEQLDSQAQAEAEAAKTSANSEVSKSLIANGSYTITPEKAAELGLVPTGQSIPLQEAQNAPNNQDIQDDGTANQLANQMAGGLAG